MQIYKTIWSQNMRMQSQIYFYCEISEGNFTKKSDGVVVFPNEEQKK